MKTRHILAIGLFVSQLLGCTYSIQAHPPINVPAVQEKIPTRAAIIIPDDIAREKIPQKNVWVGIANTWEIEAGEGLVRYSQAYFDRMFQSDRVFSEKRSAMNEGSYTLFIEPRLSDLEVSHDFVTTLSLHCSVKDKDDRLLYDATFPGTTEGKGAFTKACLGGVFTGQSSFEDSFTSAMEDAFGRLAADMNSPSSRQKLFPLNQGKEAKKSST